jgi:hypothetical protein
MRNAQQSLAAELADVSAWHVQRLYGEIDHFDDTPDVDVDEGKYGYCPACECNVRAVRVDYGFGFEHGSVRGYHRDERDECPTCEGPLEQEREEDESDA